MVRSETYRNQPIAGALFVLGASFMFAMVGTLVKVVSASLNNEMVVFFRNACSLIFILPWLVYSRPSGGIMTSCLQLHLLRSATGLGAMYYFFYAIAQLRLSEAFLLFSTSPLFIPLIAYMWMRERVTYSAGWAVIAGFIGIVLILKPGFGIFRPAMLVALAGGFLAAMAMVTIRCMWQSLLPGIWWLLILIGLLAAVGQFFLTKGYSMAPAAQVGPLTYGNVVFATLNGWIYWGETMDLLTWAGAFLVCMAGIITTRRTEAHVLVDAAVGKTPDSLEFEEKNVRK